MSFNRRRFLTSMAAGTALLPSMLRRLSAQDAVIDRVAGQRGIPDVAPSRLEPFPLRQVRLKDGIFRQQMLANRAYMLSLPTDRLAHMFRLTANLPSTADPLLGWESPTTELRGHFAGGHYLSGCALQFAGDGDTEAKAKGDALVAALSECQKANQNGYLSAFPQTLFDHLRDRVPVWAPFYTYHKIMAGHLDMYTYAGNEQALATAEAMAGWVAQWVKPLSDDQMQEILTEEYGGMGEVLYNLAAVTGNRSYIPLARRFDKLSFFDPLAERRDVLKGLHANTHIPQVIGAARSFELTGEERYHTIAEYFWQEVVAARTYSTGGTSNGEHWDSDPGTLNISTSSEECCCGYNMLKLTRHVYGWTGDARAMDYYERTLFNSRLGTQDKDGMKQYFLSLAPSGWRTYNVPFGTNANDAFWCCTGTGLEEFAKFGDTIYYHDDDGVYVNLFIASDLRWPEKGLHLEQLTSFPEEAGTRFVVHVDQPTKLDLNLRIPYWVAPGGSVSVNGETLEAFATPSSYLKLRRTWKEGDRVQLKLPMALHAEALGTDTSQQALLYGPLVLAARMGNAGLTETVEYGTNLPRMRPYVPANAEVPPPAAGGGGRGGRGGGALAGLQPPELTLTAADATSAVAPGSDPLSFQTKGQAEASELVPLYQIYGDRFAVYWKINRLYGGRGRGA